jgi:hypothetical protein
MSSERLDIPPDEQPGVDAVMRRLVDQRPVPRPGFRGDLRRTLERGFGGHSPRQVRRQAARLATAGALLMATAGISVLGAGPLAADEPAPTRAHVLAR